MTDFISQELFGIALTTLALSLFLCLNGSLVVIAFFKLRTFREIEMIKWDTIRNIEQKELRFFFRGNNYIDSEDYKRYNEINEENLKAEQESKLKNMLLNYETKIETKIVAMKNPYKKDGGDPEEILINEQKKQFVEEKQKEREKFNIIYEFIDKYNEYLDETQKVENKNIQVKEENEKIEKENELEIDNKIETNVKTKTINNTVSNVLKDDKDNLEKKEENYGASMVNKEETIANSIIKTRNKLNKKKVLFNINNEGDNEDKDKSSTKKRRQSLKATENAEEKKEEESKKIREKNLTKSKENNI